MHCPKKSFLLLATLIFLDSCGGSSDGSSPITVPSSTPSPSPTATPTPAPTATPSSQDAGSGPTLLTLTAQTPLAGTVGYAGYIRSSAGDISHADNFSTGATVPVIYNGDNGGLIYNVRTFLVPELPAGTRFTYTYDRLASSDTWDFYRATINGTQYTAKQLLIGNENATIRMLFSSVALLQASYTNTTSSETSYSIAPISYGIIFDPATKVLSGSYEYDGIVIGYARGSSGQNAYEVTGTIRLSANLSTTEMSGYIDLRGTDVRSGAVVNFGRFPYAVTPRTQLDAIYGSGTNLRLQGNFAGDYAQEFFGGADLQFNDPRQTGVVLKVPIAFAGRR